MRVRRFDRVPVHYQHGGKRVTGIHGRLLIGSRAWPTIERGGGFVHLEPRVYVVEMALMANGRRALRVLPDGIDGDTYPRPKTLASIVRGRVYAHGLERPSDPPDAPAKETLPHHLAGCIGPGVTRTEFGVCDGRLAMMQIFHELGGFELGRRFELLVQDQESR